MKKFIFGVMLLVSVLGIVGCADPSNSDGSDGTENVVYTVQNVTSSEMIISYKNKSDVYVNERIVPANGTYEIPANDAIVVIEDTDPFFGIMFKVPGVYLKVKGNNTELESYLLKTDLEKGVKIKAIFTNSFGGSNWTIETIENSQL